ncbi:MAG: class I SAM-dependent methyltransferase [Planctomycetota bacterium]
MADPDLNSYFELPELWGGRELSVPQIQLVQRMMSLTSEIAPGGRILDAGCGDGVVAMAMATHLPGLQVTGVDGSAESLRHLSGTPVEARHADLSSLPFEDGAFDLTWCMDVCEHVPMPKLPGVIAEMLRVTSGPLIIVTPSMESDAVVVSCPGCTTAFNPYHHVNSFTPERWRTMLGGARRLEFMGLGHLRAAPPRGLRGAFLAEGLSVPARVTRCPSCGEVFGTEPTGGPAPDGPVSEIAGAMPGSFAMTFDELGVIVHPEPGAGVSTLDARNAAIARIEVGDAPGTEAVLTSTNAIRFGDSGAVSQALFPFMGAGVAVSPQSQGLSADPGPDGRAWAADQEREAHLQLALDPSAPGGRLELLLALTALTEGRIACTVFDKYLRKYVPLVSGLTSPGRRTEIPIRLDIEPRFITPYGVLVQLAATGRRDGEAGAFEAVVHELADEAMPTRGLERDEAGFVIPMDGPFAGRCVRLSGNLNRTVIIGPGASFDLSSPASDAPGRFIIPASVLDSCIARGVFRAPSSVLQGAGVRP